MIKLNVEATLKKAAIERAKPKPLPKIKFATPAAKSAKPVATIQKPSVEITVDSSEAKGALSATLVQSLEMEYSQVMKERKILSSQIWKLVENGATQAQLAAHYEKIEAYRPHLQKLYDDIQYAKLHGHLPTVPETKQEPETIHSLKLQRKSLIDKRCKLKAKIAKKASANQAKYVEWELELEMADAAYNEIDQKIKKLEGKA